jgi:hypothetical protein
MRFHTQNAGSPAAEISGTRIEIGSVRLDQPASDLEFCNFLSSMNPASRKISSATGSNCDDLVPADARVFEAAGHK